MFWRNGDILGLQIAPPEAKQCRAIRHFVVTALVRAPLELPDSEPVLRYSKSLDAETVRCKFSASTPK
jgi:hypothetical protein